ncbi:MAG: hypothetical protein K8T20_12120 [Planctomycetes bacterium]|nr:hypothetical protein [Planctomycetota bacterium]
MPELQELKTEWDAGRLASIARDLLEFVRNHRADILNYRDAHLKRLRGAKVSDYLAIRMYILQVRSISPQGEIRDQLKEIEQEIWYRGENAGGQVDRQEVAREWCMRHAPGWRDHRVMAIVFVLDKIKDELLVILHGSSAQTG